MERSQRAAPGKMNRSLSQMEQDFEQEMVRERKRRDQIKKRAANRVRARKIRKVESRGKVRFSVLLVALTLTAALVVYVMFETLAWLMG